MVWSRPFALMLVASLGAFACYAALMPVIPLWATTGGADESGAGATTGTFMAAVVAGQLAMPWLLRRITLRSTLGAGLVLLGAPAPLFAVTSQLWWLIVISAVCGIGFGLLSVSGSALVAVLVPPSRRGRGSGLYGFAVGIPALVAMPLAVVVVRNLGFPPVFVAAAALPLLGLLAVWGMGRVADNAGAPAVQNAEAPAVHRGEWRRLPGPWALMNLSGLGMGVIVSFLPLATAGEGALSALALFLLPAAIALARYAAGVAGDQWGAGRLLPAGVLLGAGGMAAVAVGGAAAVLAGVVLFGIGFGVIQNQALVVMFRRVTAGTAGVVWNIGYDGGYGLGGYVLGAVIATYGFAAGFGLAAVLLAACVPVSVAVARSMAGPPRGRFRASEEERAIQVDR